MVRGKTDAAHPCFSSGGSFWTNALGELLGSGGPGVAGITVRGECHRAGYQSLALIPLRTNGVALGLVQLNSREQGRFTAEQIELYEGLAGDVATAVGDRIKS